MIHRSIPTVEAETLWQKQYSEAKITLSDLLNELEISDSSIASHQAQMKFEMRAPLPYRKRIRKGDAGDPLLRQILPTPEECLDANGFDADPLLEQEFAQSPGIIQKYQSRVLLIITQACAIHCRYCFRREFPYQDHRFSQSKLDELARYIHDKPEINEIILSGGDPLSVDDVYLEKIMSFIEQLAQIKRIRIHTRLPVVIPARITKKLLSTFQHSQKQVIMVTHVNHPNEIDDEVAEAMKALYKSGVYLLNQAVLLREINDSAPILAELSEKLFAINILPYYLFELDRVRGTHHFEVDPHTTEKLYQELLARLPGYLVPTIAREVPHQASKTPTFFST